MEKGQYLSDSAGPLGKFARLIVLGSPAADLPKAASHQLACRRAKVEYVFLDIKIRFSLSA